MTKHDLALSILYSVGGTLADCYWRTSDKRRRQLNAYVHNQNFYPSASELKTSWDNLEPFIEKLWHG